MEFKSENISEMERQRYNYIKEKGEYLEFNVLIDASTEDKLSNSMPVVSTCMHNCGPLDVANLYAVLKSYMDHLQKEYPIECLFSEVAISTKAITEADADVTDQDPPKKEE